MEGERQEGILLATTQHNAYMRVCESSWEQGLRIVLGQC